MRSLKKISFIIKDQAADFKTTAKHPFFLCISFTKTIPPLPDSSIFINDLCDERHLYYFHVKRKLTLFHPHVRCRTDKVDIWLDTCSLILLLQSNEVYVNFYMLKHSQVSYSKIINSKYFPLHSANCILFRLQTSDVTLFYI